MRALVVLACGLALTGCVATTGLKPVDTEGPRHRLTVSASAELAPLLDSRLRTSGAPLVIVAPKEADFALRITKTTTAGGSTLGTVPLVGVLRKESRPPVVRLGYTLVDTSRQTVAQGEVNGVGDDVTGVFPRLPGTEAKPSGKALDDALADLVTDLTTKLAALPWSTRLVAVLDKERVLLMADDASNLRQGTLLTNGTAVLKVSGYHPLVDGRRALTATLIAGETPKIGTRLTLK